MIATILSYLWLIVKAWWWAVLPIILWFPARSLYLWWLKWEAWYKNIRWIVLEIKPPKEILKPFRAMEDVYSLLWGFYDSANWREQWCEGELAAGPFWFSFEIASIEGNIHFYARIPEAGRNMFESAIYGHYPEAEITLVDDYIKQVPQDIPNKDWDVLGEDYVLIRDNPYPIKTYAQFFEEKPDAPKEEKRLDPLDSMLEEMSRLGPGEQFWFQLVAAPILDRDVPWITEGNELAGKIAKRTPKAKSKSFMAHATKEVTEGLVTGKKAIEAEEQERTPMRFDEEGEREMLLTPQERKILSAVENKISKHGFKTWIRGIYVHKRDAFQSRHRIVRGYVNHFATEDLNSLIYWGVTRTRIHYWWRKRRLYLRKRRIFKNYVRRLFPLYPRTRPSVWFPFAKWQKGAGWSVLNTEELATIMHLPASITVLTPAIKPIEVRKGGPPPGLPTE